MALGIGNFTYEIEVKDGTATYHFVDPEDPANTASVSLSKNDLDGMPADSREASDLAFSKVSEKMNNIRDERHAGEEKDRLDEETRRTEIERKHAQEFFDTTEDVAVKPAKIEADGTHVYNSSIPSDQAPGTNSDNAKSDKKKK